MLINNWRTHLHTYIVQSQWWRLAAREARLGYMTLLVAVVLRETSFIVCSTVQRIASGAQRASECEGAISGTA